jgi:hypothetical protein
MHKFKKILEISKKDLDKKGKNLTSKGHFYPPNVLLSSKCQLYGHFRIQWTLEKREI